MRIPSINYRELALASASAILSALAFPKFEQSYLIWIALIPLLIAIDGKSAKNAFQAAYFSGFLFFYITLYWLGHVTVIGSLVMCLYLAFYYGIFGAVYAWTRSLSLIKRLIVLPSLWVVLEFMRGSLFTGFGWSALGLALYRDLKLIQIADLAGVYGVSFLIVTVNLFLAEAFKARNLQRKVGTWIFPGLYVFLLLVSVGIYGQWRMQEQTPTLSSIPVAVVQGNIEQSIKWDQHYWPDIQDKYLQLTEEAAQTSPQLIIWPETSFTGFLWGDVGSLDAVKDMIHKYQIPLLFGSITMQGRDYFNSAVLFDSEARFVDEYHKIHLVPFGEFLPLRHLLPFLADWVPIEDFKRGEKPVLFPVLQGQGKFGVLICFEDTFGYLSRHFVKSGAQFLVNITNDAWFEDTKEPYMHLQSSVFRAIENRRYLVRSANTGISGFIDDKGRVYRYVQNSAGKKTYVQGSLTATVYLKNRLSVYTRYGDIFVLVCLVLVIGFSGGIIKDWCRGFKR